MYLLTYVITSRHVRQYKVGCYIISYLFCFTASIKILQWWTLALSCYRKTPSEKLSRYFYGFSAVIVICKVLVIYAVSFLQ